MKVAYQLLHHTTRAPAYGLLLPDSTHEALHWAVQLHEFEPRLFPTQNGWLLTTRKPITQLPAGYVALQELHTGLFIPVDAQLIPGLLGDEAAGMTKQQQVIVLPGPRFQTAPLQPVPLRSLLVIPVLEDSQWQALPEPPTLALQLTTLEYSVSPEQLDRETDQMVEEGNLGKSDPGIDGKKPRPPGSGIVKNVLASAGLGLGKALGGLGKALGSKGLAGMGANLINSAVNAVPRLSEGLLGKQEAALRSLLQMFKLGKIEEALRRALPIGGDGDLGRGASFANSAELPVNSLLFNLSSLFSFGGVGASIWLGNYDIITRLREEYRKQAELAEQRGDHRRAAYIYVKLLSDLHAAAAVLARGGLHRDSALVYLRLKDDLRAAEQFEKGGLYDRAVDLYRRLGRYELSGQLFARLKLHDEALAEFTLGADQIVKERGDYLAAGKLLLDHAQRGDLALPYFQQGWQVRPYGSAVPCALHLSALHCQARRHDELQTLFSEGLTYFNNTSDDGLASSFFNGMLNDVIITHRETVPESLKVELRDQALQHLGGRLRLTALLRNNNTALPRECFAGKTWTAAEYSDADYAYRIARKEAPADTDPLVRLRKLTIPARLPDPTCVTLAEDKGLLFVGFISGEVYRVNLHSGEMMLVSDSFRESPMALVTTPQGMHLHELRKPTFANDPFRLLLHASTASTYRFVEERILLTSNVWLSPYLLNLSGGRRCIVYGDGDQLVVHDFPNGHPNKYYRFMEDGLDLTLAIPVAMSSTDDLTLLGFDGFRLYDLETSRNQKLKVKSSNSIGWSSRFSDQQSPVQPLHCLSINLQDYVLLAGIGANSMVYLTRRGSLGVLNTHVSTGDEEYSAVCFADLTTLVATARNGLHWFHFDHQGLRLIKVQELALGKTQACFALQQGKMIVVLKDNAVLFIPKA
jgi:tetratricopeptide (TPR) repeat protein